MRFSKARLYGVAHHLPEEVVRSEALEEQLSPLYDRMGLRVGRLELMTGIGERRFFPPGTRPSEVAAAAGRAALERAGIDRARLGTLIHASVSRDFLEPATASVVHDALGLGPRCAAFDLSNACLGFVNAVSVLAGQVELGAIEAGLVVAGEAGRPLVEGTIDALLARADDVSRAELKTALASLTIGSGAAAAVVASADVLPGGASIRGTASLAATEHHRLCHGDRAKDRPGLWMETDSEALLEAGLPVARATWDRLLAELEWSPESVDRVVTHQVGTAHRRRLLAELGIDPSIDFPTVERLGNVGSVSLPLTFSLASEDGFVEAGQRVAWLGIGSGLQCQMLGLQL